MTNRRIQKALIGKKVCLRPFCEEDAIHMQRWSEDAELRRLIGEVGPITSAEAKKFCEDLRVDKTRVWFAIVEKASGKVIGEAGLLRIFMPWRSTDMTIIIGEKDAWGKGYGTEAGQLVLKYAFDKLGMHRISIGVVGFNKRALRYWKGLGFRQEGIERDDYYCDGKYSDFIMMSILENEYRALQKPKRPQQERCGRKSQRVK